MKTNRSHDPRDTKSQLGRAYWQHHARVMTDTPPKIMGHVTMAVLEGIESFATDKPESPVARMREEMLQAIGPDTPAGDPDAVERFSALYKNASNIVFPATSAYLTVCHALNEYSTSHSLYSIELDILRDIDLEAHRNQVLDTFRNDMKRRLDQVSGIDDITGYSQVFEIYGEILAYLYLRDRVPTKRVPERKDQDTPDFRCEPPDGKPFYVEVKTFDIVGGDARKRDMMDDGLDSKAELEEQIRAGKSVAMAESEIAPFRKAGETNTYDPRSLVRVIDTLREKCLGAFKEGQFEKGPTLALVVIDRLLLPSGKFDLAPYYYADFNDGGITSGVLWHLAYGRCGTPIFRLPEFAGANSLEGHLDRLGLFVDKTRPFLGPGLVVLHRAQCGRRAYGLVNSSYAAQNTWSIDDTHDVLARLCHRWNDERASRSWDISADIGAQVGV